MIQTQIQPQNPCTSTADYELSEFTFSSLFNTSYNTFSDELDPVNINPKLLSFQHEVLKQKMHILQEKLEEAEKRKFTLENDLCVFRERISDFAAFLKIEREKLQETLDTWLTMNRSAKQLCESIKMGPHYQFQETICDIMTRISCKYPRYQIKRSENMGIAVDNALGTVEVCVEDSHILRRELDIINSRILEEDQLQIKLENRLKHLQFVRSKMQITI